MSYLETNRAIDNLKTATIYKNTSNTKAGLSIVNFTFLNRIMYTIVNAKRYIIDEIVTK